MSMHKMPVLSGYWELFLSSATSWHAHSTLHALHSTLHSLQWSNGMATGEENLQDCGACNTITCCAKVKVFSCDVHSGPWVGAVSFLCDTISRMMTGGLPKQYPKWGFWNLWATFPPWRLRHWQTNREQNTLGRYWKMRPPTQIARRFDRDRQAHDIVP